MKYLQKYMLAIGFVTLILGFTNAQAASHEMNPCNPFGAKKTVNPCNPCGTKKAVNPCNPCGGKQPANPCAGAASKVDPNHVSRPAGTKLNTGPASNQAYLLKQGQELFNDTKLSTNGLACQSCHMNNGAFLATFAEPYPHMVQMAKDRAGVKEVSLDEMVQLCMVVPMAAKPLPWDSGELAALTVYVAELQKEFQATAAKNPCSAKKTMNPCGAKKAMNPCNPCGAKKVMNPCNPCAGK